MAEICVQSKGQNRLLFTLIIHLPGYKPLLRKMKLVNFYLTDHHYFILLFLHLSPAQWWAQKSTNGNVSKQYGNVSKLKGSLWTIRWENDQVHRQELPMGYTYLLLLRPTVSIKREVAARWLQMSQCVLKSCIVDREIALNRQASPEHDSWEQAPWVIGFTQIVSPHTASPLMWISNHKVTQEGEPQTIHMPWLSIKVRSHLPEHQGPEDSHCPCM